MHSKQNDTVLQLKQQQQQQAVKAERRLGNTSTRDQATEPTRRSISRLGQVSAESPRPEWGPPPAWPVSVPGDGGADSASWLMGAPVK